MLGGEQLQHKRGASAKSRLGAARAAPESYRVECIEWGSKLSVMGQPKAWASEITASWFAERSYHRVGQAAFL